MSLGKHRLNPNKFYCYEIICLSIVYWVRWSHHVDIKSFLSIHTHSITIIVCRVCRTDIHTFKVSFIVRYQSVSQPVIHTHSSCNFVVRTESNDFDFRVRHFWFCDTLKIKKYSMEWNDWIKFKSIKLFLIPRSFLSLCRHKWTPHMFVISPIHIWWIKYRVFNDTASISRPNFCLHWLLSDESQKIFFLSNPFRHKFYSVRNW